MPLIKDAEWESFRGPVRADYFYGLLPTTTPTAPTTGGTIATAGIASARLNPAADITAMVLAAGTYDGQRIELRNVSAHTITFDTNTTSHVAAGASCVIVANTVCVMVYDSVLSYWLNSGL